MSDLIAGDFNYASVDEETAQKLEYFVKTGKALYRKHQIQFIADFGKLLSEAREVLANHGDGMFAKWAIAEFDISKATVYRYVNTWEKCLSAGGSFHNGTNFMNWSPTALYMLADDEIPKPVQKKLEKIPATDLVRACDVKRLIAASKPKPEPVEEVEHDPDDLVADSDYADDSEDIEELAQELEPKADTGIPATEPPQASIMLDSLGKQIPKNLRSASELAIQLQATGRELDKYRQAAKDFAEQPGGEWLRVQDISAGIKTLKDHFQQAAYHTVCPTCSGKGCKTCELAGWIPAYLKGTL